MKITRNLLLPALLLPLTAGTCTSDKFVELVVGLPTEAEFEASGELNIHDDEELIDVKEDMDVEGELDDAGVDPAEIQQLTAVQVFYKITVPEAGRTIEDGYLEFERVGVGGTHLLVSGFSADCSQATDWIDVTDKLQPGINDINAFLAEYLVELQGGAPVQNTTFRYHVQGVSVPGDVETNFQWRFKVVIQARASREYEVPFG